MIYVTLHVGLDTFKPVETEDVEQHHIHTEYMEVTGRSQPRRFAAARAEGRRVIAVGTTSVRVLETMGERGLSAFTGDTRLFIYPGYQVPRRRRNDHQFSLAQIIVVDAGRRVRRERDRSIGPMPRRLTRSIGFTVSAMRCSFCKTLAEAEQVQPRLILWQA